MISGVRAFLWLWRDCFAELRARENGEDASCCLVISRPRVGLVRRGLRIRCGSFSWSEVDIVDRERGQDEGEGWCIEL